MCSLACRYGILIIAFGLSVVLLIIVCLNSSQEIQNINTFHAFVKDRVNGTKAEAAVQLVEQIADASATNPVLKIVLAGILSILLLVSLFFGPS